MRQSAEKSAIYYRDVSERFSKVAKGRIGKIVLFTICIFASLVSIRKLLEKAGQDFPGANSNRAT